MFLIMSNLNYGLQINRLLKIAFKTASSTSSWEAGCVQSCFGCVRVSVQILCHQSQCQRQSRILFIQIFNGILLFWTHRVRFSRMPDNIFYNDCHTEEYSSRNSIVAICCIFYANILQFAQSPCLNSFRHVLDAIVSKRSESLKRYD